MIIAYTGTHVGLLPPINPLRPPILNPYYHHPAMTFEKYKMIDDIMIWFDGIPQRD